jgi:hypothetical protein
MAVNCDNGCFDEDGQDGCNHLDPNDVGPETLRKSVYHAEVQQLLDQAAEQAIITEQLTPEQSITLNYSTRAANLFLAERLQAPVTGPVLTQQLFPNLFERLRLLPTITEAEILRFSQTTDTPIFSLPRLWLPENATTTLRRLDRFFSPSGSVSGAAMGSFCSLVPNIFAQFGELQQMFDNAMGFFARAQEIFNQIQDQGARGLIEQLKQQLLSAFDGIIENFRQQLMSMATDFIAIPQMLAQNMTSMFERLHSLRLRAQEFLREDVIANIRQRIEGLVAQATSLFDPATFTIEEAQFLLLRFCEFIGNIESFFDGLLQPLRDVESIFTSTIQSITNSGSIATARAVGAGAIRLPPQAREQGARAAATIPQTPYASRTQPTAPSAATPPVPSVPGAPSPSPATPPRAAAGQTAGTRGSTFRPVRDRHFQIMPPTPQEMALIAEYTRLLDTTGSTPDIEYSGRRTPNGGQNSWQNVQLPEFVALIRLSRALGRRLTVLSAYRGYGVVQNTSSGRRPVYGYHTSGQAFDVSMSGFSAAQRQQFNAAANAQGFGPTRFYLNDMFTHIDSGPDRPW